MGELVGVTWDRHNAFFTGIDLGRMPGWRFFQETRDHVPEPGVTCILEREINEAFTLDEDEFTCRASHHWPASALEAPPRFADLDDLLTTLSAFQEVVSLQTTDGGSHRSSTGRIRAVSATEITFQGTDTGAFSWRPASQVAVEDLIALSWGTTYSKIVQAVFDAELG